MSRRSFLPRRALSYQTTSNPSCLGPNQASSVVGANYASVILRAHRLPLWIPSLVKVVRAEKRN